MYEKFFNLKSKPFELVPNPEFLYQSPSHKKALNYLNYGLRERAGFILLTGEVGSGKTTIIKNLIKNLDDDVELSILFNTRVSSKQLVALINDDFGLDVGRKDKITLLHDLNDHLLELHAQNKRPVIIIDEAQNLDSHVLEELRLISNLEVANAKLIQIILVGQPELNSTLAKDKLRQLRQRISVHCQLMPLTREEVEDYVFHRLETAGNRNALKWENTCFDLLYLYSQGMPRLINIFCDFILLSAFAEETRELTPQLVEEVICDVSWNSHIGSQESRSINSAHASNDIEKIFLNQKELIAITNHVSLIQQEISHRLDEHEQFIKDIHERQIKSFKSISSTLIDTQKQFISIRQAENSFLHKELAQTRLERELLKKAVNSKEAPQKALNSKETPKKVLKSKKVPSKTSH